MWMKGVFGIGRIGLYRIVMGVEQQQRLALVIVFVKGIDVVLFPFKRDVELFKPCLNSIGRLIFFGGKRLN